MLLGLWDVRPLRVCGLLYLWLRLEPSSHPAHSAMGKLVLGCVLTAHALTSVGFLKRLPNSLTLWSRFLLEKLRVTPPLKQFPSPYPAPTFTRARHWSLSSARWIQSTPSQSYFFKIHYNILPFTPRFSKWFLTSNFRTTILQAFQFSLMSSTCPVPLLFLYLITLSSFSWCIPHIKVGSSRNASDLYSGGTHFESCPGHRLSVPKYFVPFFSPSRELPGEYLKLGYNCFLPHSF
jgi:hypothetical protein